MANPVTPAATDLKKIWCRAGITLMATEDEVASLMDTNATSADVATIIRKIISENRFQWDGNSYIPCCAIYAYNEEYGTDFDDENEPEWDF